MRRPRGHVVVRRFLDGESIAGIAVDLWISKGWRQANAVEWIEQAIRRAFDRAEKVKGKKQ